MLQNKVKFVGFALGVALLVGCQQHATTSAAGANIAQPPAAVNAPRPPVSARQYSQQRQAQEAQSQQQTVITVHLAQEQAEPSLIAIELDENQALYALPQPVLTQADMKEVTPVTARDGSTFIMFDLTPQGSAKLANVSTQARGHYFLISAKGQLFSVAQISEPMTDGQLLISTAGAEHTQQILELLR